MKHIYKTRKNAFRWLTVAVLSFCTMLFSLPVRAQTINLSLDKVTVREAVKVLNETENYSIAIKSGDVDMSRTVTVKATDATLEEVLDQIFLGQNVSYSITGNSISVTKELPGRNNIPVTTEQRQETARVLRGTVTDSYGEPMIGVTILLPELNRGEVTGLDGNFIFRDLDLPVRLEASFIGFETQVITVTNYRELSIVLRESTDILDEIVIVGYGTQRRANLTGAVSTISSKDINERPVATLAGALQGADPSVNLSFSTGSPDAGYSVNVRGRLSINAGNPLILADGVEVSLSQINPNDVESISVLKDASSSSIYGAKASAGVILITTKKGGGKDGKAKVSYSSRFGIAQNTTSTDFIRTGYDHVVLSNQFYNAYNGVDMFQYTEANGGLSKLWDRRNDVTEHPDRPWTEIGEDGRYYYYANFDWYGYFYNRNRPQQEHNVSLSGGNEDFNYYASGRYYQQYGIFNIYKDIYDDYSFRTKIEAKITPWLRYSNNVSFNSSSYSYAGRFNYDHTISALQSNISASYLPRNPDGSIVQYTNQLYANSPLGAGHGGFLTANTSRNSRANRYLTLTNQLDFDITKDLVLTANYAYMQRDGLNRYRNNTFDYSRQDGVFATFTSGSVLNNYQEIHSNYKNHNVNIYGTYRNSWNNSHNLTIVGGGQYEEYRQTSLSATQTDLTTEELASFAVATGVMTLSQSISAYRTLGFFGRVNYDYKGKYLLEFSARGDGSSRFEPGSRWGFFPSASAGWRISDEPFWDNARRVVNNFKLRFSAGSLGNQQVSNYAYIDKLSIDNRVSYTFDGLALAYYASVSDPVSAGLTWETITTYDVGVDMSFLNARLNLVADYYIRDTKNMLTPSLTLPAVYGASTPRANSANLRTKGWEIILSWNDHGTMAGKPFSYGIQASLGDYKTTITKFNNPNKLISDYYEGMTLGEIWGYQVAGLFKTDYEAAQYQAAINDRAVNQRVYNCKGAVGNYLRAGDVKFMDLDEDSVISQGSGTVDDPGDLRIIGNSLPRFAYSMRLNFSWAGIDFSAFFQGVGQRNWFPAQAQSSFDFWGPYAFPSTSFIHTSFADNVWTEENRNAYFPRPRGYQAYSGGSLGEVNDRYLQNVAYLRFKNLTVGYTIPAFKGKVDRIRIYFTGENLWYWSPLKKYTRTVDPELTVTSGTYVSNSGTGYAYSKTFSLGLNITF